MSGAGGAAVRAVGLRKVYRGGKEGDKTALEHLDLTVPEGSFFALLGPNGAGKSTFINILSGLTNPTGGAAYVNGYDVIRDYRRARASLGVVPQEPVLDPFFPVFEALENTAGYYGVPKAERRTQEIIEALGLADKARTPARRLSGGMRRRLLVAKALVHSPRVLILDEPTAGVDVELRTKLWDYVRGLHKSGVTVILTTHYLEEAEQLCDRAAVIRNGKLIAEDSKENLTKRLSRKQVTAEFAAPPPFAAQALADFSPVFKGERTLVFSFDRLTTSFDAVLRALLEAGAPLKDVSVQDPSLEDVFLHLMREHGGA